MADMDHEEVLSERRRRLPAADRERQAPSRDGRRRTAAEVVRSAQIQGSVRAKAAVVRATSSEIKLHAGAGDVGMRCVADGSVEDWVDVVELAAGEPVEIPVQAEC